MSFSCIWWVVLLGVVCVWGGGGLLIEPQISWNCFYGHMSHSGDLLHWSLYVVVWRQSFIVVHWWISQKHWTHAFLLKGLIYKKAIAVLVLHGHRQLDVSLHVNEKQRTSLTKASSNYIALNSCRMRSKL